jgi:hypothetical protein
MNPFYDDAHRPWWVRKLRRIIKGEYGNYANAAQAFGVSVVSLRNWGSAQRTPDVARLEEALNRVGHRITSERIPER